MTPSTVVRFGLAVTALVVLTACSSREDRIASGLKKGAEFARISDWDKVNVEMRNVLQIDPKNAQAYAIAGQASEGQRDLQRAYGQYMKALELQPELVAARVGLSRLYLVTGDTVRAQTTVDEALRAAPRDAGARSVQAALLAGQGRTAEAKAIGLELLSAGAGAPVDASLMMAGLLANDRDWLAALDVVESALKSEPRHLGLLQAAMDIAAANPKDAAVAARAEGLFRRATEASPRNNDLWFAWARHHQGRQEIDKAEAVLREAVRVQPDDSRRRLALLEYLTSARGAAVAEKAYLQAIADKPRDMAQRFGLAALYRGAGRHDEAQKVLQEIAEKGEGSPDALTARSQLASYRLAAGRPAEARELAEQVLKANPRDNAALVLRGRLALAEGRAKDAVVDLRGALRDQPTAPDIVALLAQAHRAAGEGALGREVVAEAVKQRPQDAVLRALLAADLADARQFDAALAELDAGIKLQPQATRLYELKSQIALQNNDKVLARRALEQLVQARPGDAIGHVRLGQLHTRFQRLDLALKAYDAGIAAAPADPVPYIAAVTLLGAMKRHDEALARVQARARQEPGSKAMHLQLQAEVEMSRGNTAEAQKAFRAAAAAAPQLLSAHLGVARALAAGGDTAGALLALKEAEALMPTERQLPMTRADLLVRLRRTDEAIALYEDLAQRFPEDDNIVNNLAYLLADVRSDPAAMDRALTLATRLKNSSNPGHLDSLGWIHYRLGQYDKALPLFERAVALAPPSPLLQLHLGKALIKTGDTARGKAMLQRALDSKVELPRAEEARAMLAAG